tara:strand:+ start:3055 stop:5088 length:2034 start_codon:yes stop_codon:yes gene_type:complete
MNILEQEDIIKGLPDAALMQEASAPSGQVPQFLVVSEIKRRSDMRKRYDQQEQQEQGTVKDQILAEAMGGIAPMMPTAMTPPAQPMGPAGPPPNGAMPPPMGGMPPQGAPPMAPPMPQGMPPMPMGGIASAPQAMPPMGMAQGGIVRMDGGGALPSGQFRLFDGSTIADKMAELLDRVRRGELAYSDVLANISSLPASDARDMALSYVQSEVGGNRASAPASRLRMEEGMFGYSDKDADIMGTMEAPLPEREAYPPGKQGREAFSKAFTDTLESNDAIFYGADGDGIGSLPAEKDIAGARSAFMGRTTTKPGTESAAPIAGILEVAQTAQTDASAPKRGTPGFIPGVTNIDVGFGEGMVGNAGGFGPAMFDSLRPEGGGYLSQLGRYLASEEFDPRLTGGDTSRAQVANQLLGIGPDGPVRSPFGQKKEDAPTTLTTPPALTGENIALIDELSALTAGSNTRNPDITVQGNNNNAQTQGTGANPPALTPEMPALDFSDLIAEGKQQALANAMIQLGAGVAAGDVAKGLSAAGTAATKGTADARALDMRRRLTEYEAGREDVRRGEEKRRYDEGMKLKRDQFNSDIEYRAADLNYKIDAASGLNRRALLNSVNDMIKEVNDEIIRSQGLGVAPDDPIMTGLQGQLALLKKQGVKYSDDIAASLARAEKFDGFEVLGTR